LHPAQSAAIATIEQHEPARRDERLLRLLLPHGDAGVIGGLDAIASPGVTTLSLGRGNA
jgi:hypothetical protein